MSKERHVRVWYNGRPPADYRAESTTAQRFAEASLLDGAVVIVDSHVQDGMQTVPPEEQWPHR
jgi:hypothetical protein